MNSTLSLCDVYQFIIIGSEMIGKTSIINRYFDDVFFSDLTRTLAIDYKSKKLEEDINRYNILRILDTGGQERYDALTHSYYKHGECILLCFSICNRHSFDKLDYYLYNIKTFGKSDSIIILVGTFQDKEKDRDISEQEIKEFQKYNNLEYFEISSKTGFGLNELFNRSLELLKNKRKQTGNINKTVYEKNTNTKLVEINKTRECCILQ
jgi:small GTP-binding protein